MKSLLAANGHAHDELTSSVFSFELLHELQLLDRGSQLQLGL
jgi:hypothetical protein